MKKLLGILFIPITFTVAAQNKLQSIKLIPAITQDIEKVAKDYYAHFSNIKGEKISETENIIEYASKINPQDAVESTIMQIKSLENSYSWQALMLNTEDYHKAVAKYKQLYRQLSGVRFSMNDGKNYKLKGLYDAPDEARAFASSLLGLDVKDKEMQRFKIEIALNYALPDWSVKIYVYEKEDDEDIRPIVHNSEY